MLGEIMKSLNDKIILSSGTEIPVLGFGTWQAPDGEIAASAVTAAISAGYRHIDTAAIYRNEESVGKAIAASGIDRKDIFVTTKLWNKCRTYDLAYEAFERSITKLGLDYIDLYLIHWPASPSQFENWEEQNLDTWRAMTELYKAGRIKAIGVSNFMPHHLAALMKTEVAPMVNQIELHPGYTQRETVAFCRENGIAIEAWSPLGSGRVLSDERLMKIAAGYGKSVAQLCIRWCLQSGFIPLPKSVNSERIKENADVFDFEISGEDMEFINSMPDFAESGFHPDKADF